MNSTEELAGGGAAPRGPAHHALGGELRDDRRGTRRGPPRARPSRPRASGSAGASPPCPTGCASPSAPTRRPAPSSSPCASSCPPGRPDGVEARSSPWPQRPGSWPVAAFVLLGPASAGRGARPRREEPRPGRPSCSSGRREARAKKRKPRTVQTTVPLSRVSRSLIQAVISSEDQKFFGHDGIDWAGDQGVGGDQREAGAGGARAAAPSPSSWPRTSTSAPRRASPGSCARPSSPAGWRTTSPRSASSPST